MNDGKVYDPISHLYLGIVWFQVGGLWHRDWWKAEDRDGVVGLGNNEADVVAWLRQRVSVAA